MILSSFEAAWMREASFRRLPQASGDTRHSETGLPKEQTMALEDRQHRLGPDHPHTIESLRELARLYESWPKLDEAATLRAKLPRRDDAAKRD